MIIERSALIAMWMVAALVVVYLMTPLVRYRGRIFQQLAGIRSAAAAVVAALV